MVVRARTVSGERLFRAGRILAGCVRASSTTSNQPHRRTWAARAVGDQPEENWLENATCAESEESAGPNHSEGRSSGPAPHGEGKTRQRTG